MTQSKGTAPAVLSPPERRISESTPRPKHNYSKGGHSVANKLHQLVQQAQSRAILKSAASSDDVWGCVTSRKRGGPLEKLCGLYSIDMGQDQCAKVVSTGVCRGFICVVVFFFLLCAIATGL